MEATTNATRTLKIDGMTGDVCVKKVTAALRDVPGISTQSVEVGSATFKGDQAACTAACSAIKAAGFTAREGSGACDTKEVACGAPNSQTEFKASGQACSPAQKSMGDSACSSGKDMVAPKTTDRPAVITPAKPALTTN